MLKKTITFNDFNGNEVTETHHFHLSKAELVEMEVSHPGGLHKWLEQVIESEDGKAIIQTFKDLILDSYGKKSDDGKRFVKTTELREQFQSGNAYEALFMELCTNAGSAAAFVNGLLPTGLEQDLEKITDKPSTPPVLDAPVGKRGGEVEAEPVKQRVLSQVEIREMPSDELQRLLASGEARIASSGG